MPHESRRRRLAEWLRNVLLERILPNNWIGLRNWGNSRLIKTSYLWLLIVPIAAKMLQPIVGIHTFELFGANLTIHIGLPFSWTLFYTMAFLFSLGQGIYAFQCHPLIKAYTTHVEYRRDHAGTRLIADHFSDIVFKRDTDKWAQIELAKFLATAQSNPNEAISSEARDYAARLFESDDPDMIPSVDTLVAVCAKDNAVFDDLFQGVQNYYSHKRPRWARASAVLFVAGFVLFAVVVIQNSWYVWRNWFA